MIEIAAQCGRTGRVGLVGVEFAETLPVLVLEAVETRDPAIAAADHRRLHQEGLPAPRRPQRAVDDGPLESG